MSEMMKEIEGGEAIARAVRHTALRLDHWGRPLGPICHALKSAPKLLFDSFLSLAKVEFLQASTSYT